MKYYYLLICILLLTSCKNFNESENIIHGEAQGSTYQIKYIGEKIPNLRASIDSILEVIDVSMSTYRDDSLISKVNKGEEIEVDNHFRNVFLSSQKIWNESNHLFDPTVGVLANAWGFGRSREHKVLSKKSIDSLLQFVGFNKVHITDNNMIQKDSPEISFDFNAIAQGYTVDVLSNYLKNKGIQNFIVEVGGELYVAGKNTITHKPWTIGIDNPLQGSDKRTLIATVQFSNKGMATSGNYRKVWTDEIGQQYVHTINPLTGKTQTSEVLSVTVIAKTTMEADGYATAFMVMGLDKTKKFLLAHPELEVYINYSDKNLLRSFSSKGFQDYIVSENSDEKRSKAIAKLPN